MTKLIKILKPLPSIKTSNPYYFSMHDLDGLNNLLQSYSKLDHEKPYANSRGCSVTCCWSGEKGYNIPVKPYENKTASSSKNTGIVLKPSKLEMPQANTFAYYSGSKLSSRELYKPSKRGSGFANRPAFIRTLGMACDFAEITLTNQARWESTSHIHPKTGMEYQDGSPYVFARNIWKKANQKDRKIIMETNEGITFQKDDENPICGLLIAGKITEQERLRFILLLEQNTHLNLYLYNIQAEENCMRQVNKAKALALLQTKNFSQEYFIEQFKACICNSDTIGSYITGEDPSLFRSVSQDKKTMLASPAIENEETMLASPVIKDKKTIFTSDMNMQVLSGFIAALGIASVAVAFIALSTPTLVTAGLITFAFGSSALVLGGIGFFKNTLESKRTNNIKSDLSLAL